MHRPQRSSFVWLASIALSALASCTLTTDDFEPDVSNQPESADDADPLLPAADGPSEDPGAGEGDTPAVSGELPSDPSVPLTPSEPSNAGSDGSPPCTSGCCAGLECSEEEPDEVDDPCAGGACPRPPGAACDTAEDCDSAVCDGGLCQAASCSDAVQNANEAGLDCGGSACVPCPCSYGAPELLGDPNFAGNLLFSPSLSADRLTLYFGLYVQGATELIAFSTRPSVAAPFGLGNALPASINASIEGTPRLSADGLTLYFYSERAGGLGGRDIYRAQRSAPGANFEAVTNLTEINSPGVDHLPWIAPDGLTLYFTSDRSGDLDIHRARRASTNDSWQAPERVTELNTTAVDNGMTLTSDELEIVFASYRQGGSDFYRAVRAPGEPAFRAPEYLTSINTDADETDPALSADGTELYFSSTRDGTDSRIWRVSRSCP